MIRFLIVLLFCWCSSPLFAGTILVKNNEELKAANKIARPGDTIILQTGEWANVEIRLTCNGTAEKPILVKAAAAGKVRITGQSHLKIGGEYIIVDGLYFTNGFAGKEPVISFRTGKDNLANHCRVTNCVVDNFNNIKRMDENNWVLFYGKNNRLDHCSFRDKNNMGVLLAVILDDERSRENFHSIDHNYFGRRLPLGSNGGEIIRVGVSQHCEYNSNTAITGNFFEHCDGETEIISIKSGSNQVKGNVFKESQGSVVLRHGNDNTVKNNLFLGNGKTATGGVRVINRGQWVVNNFFYKCKGQDFRSPLAIMNGIPNSPAHRYVQVTDAVIANNSFYDCSPVSFGEGSDAERTLPPQQVLLVNNLFLNSRDSIIYRVFDAIDGIHFTGNEVSNRVPQALVPGFVKTNFAIQTNPVAPLPLSLKKGGLPLPDSIQSMARARLNHTLSTKPGFANMQLLKQIHSNALNNAGAAWFRPFMKSVSAKPVVVKCADAAAVYRELKKNKPAIIELTGVEYTLDKPFSIETTILFRANPRKRLVFVTGEMPAVFITGAGAFLQLENLQVDGGWVKATSFIASSGEGPSGHYSLVVKGCQLYNLGNADECRKMFYACKSMIADSIVFRENSFHSNAVDAFDLSEEKDDKGYYNAEKIILERNQFEGQQGALLKVYRGGNDESTLGPAIYFRENKLVNCNNTGTHPLISLTGVQVTEINANQFTNCNVQRLLVLYKDTVRARHLFNNNLLIQSGTLQKNQYVTETGTQLK